MREPRPSGPSREHPGRQTEQGNQTDNRETAAGLLHRLLRKGFLVGRRIGRGNRGAVEGQHLMSAPEVLLGYAFPGLGA